MHSNEPNEQQILESRLTAYVLGELDDVERAEVEAMVERDPAARAEVESIRRTVSIVEDELPAETTNGLSFEQRSRIEDELRGERPALTIWSRRSLWLGVGTTAVAASVALAFALPLWLGSVDDADEYAIGGDRSGVDSAPAMEGLAPDFEEQPAQARRGGRQNQSVDGRSGLTSEARRQAQAPTAPPAETEALAQGGRQDAGRPMPGGGGGFGGGGASFLSGQTPPRPPADAKFADDRFARDFHESREEAPNTEQYDRIVDNPFIAPLGERALSTFAIDVDTASYANVRRFLQNGQLPPADAVRIEEMINYFDYDYAPPVSESEHPFKAHVEIAQCPWNENHRLARIGLKGREIDMADRVATNLVFLIDVSGSMNRPDKLPLLQESMKLLVDRLTADDRVAIVVYAGSSGLVLPSTWCSDKEAVIDAIDRLRAGGSTNGGEGIRLAYSVAESNFIEGGVNRVIWATDGDLNVGVTADGSLVRMIEEKRENGVELTVLGFGAGNLKDSKLEKVSNAGNGNYAYIDSLFEAKKVLVEEAAGTLFTIAKDVKAQVEFNPRTVGAYRLIGYENRIMAAEDFRNDRKDAGEIGAGHTVTALYEIVPPEFADEVLQESDETELAFQEPAEVTDDEASENVLFELRLRYKEPGGDEEAIEFAERFDNDPQSWTDASADFRWAASVAAFGMILRDSPHKGDATLDLVERIASAADATGAEEGELERRRQCLDLVKTAKRLQSSGDGAR